MKKQEYKNHKKGEKITSPAHKKFSQSVQYILQTLKTKPLAQITDLPATKKKFAEHYVDTIEE